MEDNSFHNWSFLLYQSLIDPVSFHVQAWNVYSVFVTVAVDDRIHKGQNLAHDCSLKGKGCPGFR